MQLYINRSIILLVLLRHGLNKKNNDERSSTHITNVCSFWLNVEVTNS